MKRLFFILLSLLMTTLSFARTVSDDNSKVFVKIEKNADETVSFFRCEKDLGCIHLGSNEKYTHKQLKKAERIETAAIVGKSIADVAVVAALAAATAFAGPEIGFIASKAIPGATVGIVIDITKINPMANYYRKKYLKNVHLDYNTKVEDIDDYIFNLQQALSNIK